MKPLRSFALTLALPLLATAQNPITFQDVTNAVGITWQQSDNGIRMGAGGAFLDYDGDGWQDIILVGGAVAPALYRNVGGTGFVLETQANFVHGTAAQQHMCVAVGDVDNDGDPDVFLGVWGPNELYRNDGGGVFTRITTPQIAGTTEWTTAAAFGDYNNDGNIDLYLGNYVAPPFSFPNHTPTPNKLLRGAGTGSFADVSTPVVTGGGTALAVTWSDYDDDGDVDLFVGNDFGEFVEPNRLLRNDGPGAGHTWSFTDVSAETGADIGIYCMGIAAGDIDRDRDLDYYFTNLGTNSLLLSENGSFTDIAIASGVDATHDPVAPDLFATSWSVGFVDFDHDSWLDIYVSNGHVPAAQSLANGLMTPNMVFQNDGTDGTTFTDVSTAAGPGVLDGSMGRGCAFADFDNDGDIDVLQVSCQATPVLLRNTTVSNGSWLRARLGGRLSDRDGLGSRVEATVADHVAVREVSRNYGYQSSSEPDVHFGLGAHALVRKFEVRWPSGVWQQLYDLPVDTELAVVEPLVTVDANLQILAPTSPSPIVKVIATLQNHDDSPVTVYDQPQLRFAHDSPVAVGVPGNAFWAGSMSQRTIPANGVEIVELTLSVPPAALTPEPIIDVVWRVADTLASLDETKVGIYLR